jgi:hypothetical protein
MMWALLWACFGPPEPELGPVRVTLDAWEAGRDALEAGDAAAAREAFGRARESHDDPLLATWEAAAEVKLGRDDRAVAILSEVLEARPGFREARYNLGCSLARLGRHEEASREVALAILAGAITPRAAARDPALAPHLGLPAWDLLPDEPLAAVLRVPTGLAYLGSAVEVSLGVSGAEPGPVRLTGAAATGPISLTQVVEDVGRDELGDREAVITWTLLVRGAGEVAVAPVAVASGAWRAAAAGAAFPTAAPTAGAPSTTLALPSLSALSDGLTAPAARREGEGLLVVAPPGSRVEAAREPTWLGKLRDGGEPVVDVVWFEVAPAAVTVRRGGGAPWTWPAAGPAGG